MSERVTVQAKIGRSATTNPLDERINQYQSIGWMSRSGTGIVICQRASLDLLWAEMLGRRRLRFLLLVLNSTKTRHVSAFFKAPMKSTESCSHWTAGPLASQQGQQDSQNCARTLL